MVKPLSNAERKRKYRQNVTNEKKKEIKENDKTRQREKKSKCVTEIKIEEIGEIKIAKSSRLLI